MMNMIQKIGALLWGNKGKFVLMIFSTLAFLVILFPFGDLSDLISAQVSKLTRNQVYLQFEKMSMSFFPSPGVGLEEVHVEPAGFPALKSKTLVMSPSLSTLITQKPAGSLAATGFLNGDVEVSLKSGSKSDNGVERQRIVVSAKKLSLNELRELLQLPVSLRGNVDLNTTALADLSFREQPDMDLSLKVERFELPTANVNTMMGPLTLPELKLASVELQGRLSAGKFIIEKGLIGKETDDLHGTIKGNIGLQVQNQGSAIVPVMGGYSLDVDFSVNQAFQERANLFLTFVDAYKSPSPKGAQYKFKVSAPNSMMPPNISALR